MDLSWFGDSPVSKPLVFKIVFSIFSFFLHIYNDQLSLFAKFYLSEDVFTSYTEASNLYFSVKIIQN